MTNATASQETRTARDALHDWVRGTEYVFSRGQATAYGTAVGVAIGIGLGFLDVDLTLGPQLLMLLAAAVITVVLLHEGLHGGTGRMLGHRPVFGFQPPLVYTTFREKIPRDNLIVIAIAPLLILDAVFITLYTLGWLETFAVLCFAVNTIGAMGDVWIALKISRCSRRDFIQDTKTGVTVWRRTAPRANDSANRT